MIATLEDIPAWLDLAREVEYLFGPMCEDPGFYNALRKNIDRGTAFCIRGGDGSPGAPHFYEQFDFYAAEPAPDGPEGGSRQIFRRMIR